MGNILSPEAGPLFSAIEEGDVNAAVKALEAHPRLSQKRAGKKSRTVYHACASNGHVAVLKRLCEHVWQTLPDELGKTHANSIPEGRFHPVIFGAVNSYDELGLTPLMLACKKGHADVVEYLLSQGADPWLGDRLLGRSALHHAARANQVGCIEVILNSPYVELSGKVRSKECKLVDYPNVSGYTPLHYAAPSRSADAAMILLRYGASPNTKTWDTGFDFIQLDRGSTPLHAAARFQNLELAMAMLKHWDENLRDQGIIDPRVVENSERIKPVQTIGIKMNRALVRVLDPITPIKEISDPFGETDRRSLTSSIKVLPTAKSAPGTKLQEDDGDPSTTNGWTSNNKLPAGWDDGRTSRTGIGSNGRNTGRELITVYQCAEFDVESRDCSRPLPPVGVSTDGPVVKRASTGLGLLRSQSDGRYATPELGASSTAAAAAAANNDGLSRTRSGAAITSHPDSFRFGTRNLSKPDDNGMPKQDCPPCPSTASRAPPSPAILPLSPQKPPNGKTPFTGMVLSPAAQGPVSEGQLPSPSGWIQPVTPPRGDLAASGGLRTLRSMDHNTVITAGGGGGSGLKRTASGTLHAKLPFVDTANSKHTVGWPFTRSSSNRMSAQDATNTETATGAGMVAATPSALGLTRSRSRGASPPGGSRDASVPQPAFSAWSDKLSSTATAAAALATAAHKGPATMDFTRDSHAEDSQPVEVTMYPHRLEQIEVIKQGETCNVARTEGGGTGSAARCCSPGPSDAPSAHR